MGAWSLSHCLVVMDGRGEAMTKWYDVTRVLSEEIVVYPGDIVPRFTREDHGKYLITGLSISTHSGTHIDAPSHYLKNDATIDLIPLDALNGPCRVIDLSRVKGEIGAEEINDAINGEARVFFYTGYQGINSFDPGYRSLGIDAAAVLANRGVCCIGIDSPSIESFDGNGDVHRELLGKNIVIIEFLDLSGVPPGDYHMIALPLRLKGLDGSPARVVLCR
jgi:arylformamidase